MLFIGNCQAESAYRKSQQYFAEAKLLLLVAFAQHGERGVRWAKQEIVQRAGLVDYRQMLQEGDLVPQPSWSDVASHEPEFVVLSLFHERPVIQHKVQKYYLGHLESETTRQIRPQLSNWISDEFELVAANGEYFEKFLTLVEHLRELWPQVPVVVLKRLSHAPALGACRCSNGWWMRTWDKWPELASQLSTRFSNVSCIDLDRVLAGQVKHENFETLIPGVFLLQKGDSFSLVRDTEHLGHKMWERVAELLRVFAVQGLVEYNADEKAGMDWDKVRTVPRMSEEELNLLLASGDLFLQRKALNVMIVQEHACPARLLLDHAPELQFHYRFFCSFQLLVEIGKSDGLLQLVENLRERNEELYPVGSFKNEQFRTVFDTLCPQSKGAQ